MVDWFPSITENRRLRDDVPSGQLEFIAELVWTVVVAEISNSAVVSCSEVMNEDLFEVLASPYSNKRRGRDVGPNPRLK